MPGFSALPSADPHHYQNAKPEALQAPGPRLTAVVDVVGQAEGTGEQRWGGGVGMEGHGVGASTGPFPAGPLVLGTRGRAPSYPWV